MYFSDYYSITELVLKTNSKWAVVHLGYGVKYTVLLAKWSKAVKLIPRLHAAVCKLAAWKLPEDSSSSEMHGKKGRSGTNQLSRAQ